MHYEANGDRMCPQDDVLHYSGPLVPLYSSAAVSVRLCALRGVHVCTRVLCHLGLPSETRKIVIQRLLVATS